MLKTYDGKPVSANKVWVYVIGSPMIPDAVKIGITNNILLRLKQHQTGNPFPLCVIASIGPFHKEQAKKLETQLLQAQTVVSGEWVKCKFAEGYKVLLNQ